MVAKLIWVHTIPGLCHTGRGLLNMLFVRVYESFEQRRAQQGFQIKKARLDPLTGGETRFKMNTCA